MNQDFLHQEHPGTTNVHREDAKAPIPQPHGQQKSPQLGLGRVLHGKEGVSSNPITHVKSQV